MLIQALPNELVPSRNFRPLKIQLRIFASIELF